MHRSFLSLAAALITSATAVLSTAVAEPSLPSVEQSHEQSLTGRELTRPDLEAWLDGLVPYAMASGNVAGGVVVVVKDGAVLLQKGYGYADVESKKPVDPERTLFRLGSIAKIFTWTAVMQLVDQGKIDLDRDINEYLDFKIPVAGKPITMRHLMTHTAGFEELIKNMAGAGPAQLHTLEAYVKASVPKLMYVPGEVPSYSNYGAALAGYIVQRVSGESFDDYLDLHVFGPLGMQRSSFRQPLPEALARDLSSGYGSATDAPWYFEICNPSPAGSLSATGSDIAQFMLAHLRAQSGGDTRLLRPEAAGVLHGSISRPIPTVNGLSLGFEVNRDARRIIGHGGDTQVFHSDMKLYLEDGIGLFMAFNSDGDDGATYDILTKLFVEFTERYSPVALPEEPTAPTALEHGKLLAAAGPYQSSRRADSNFLRMLALLGQQDIEVNDDGTLVLPSETGINGQPKLWREVAPFVWREVGGVQRIGAIVVDGQVRALGLDQYAGTQILQPASLTNASRNATQLVTWATIALLLTLIHWPVAALVRRHYAVRLWFAPLESRVRVLVRIGSFSAVAFLVGWMLVLQAGMKDISNFGDSLDPWLRLLHLLGLLATAGTVAAICNAWLAWRGDHGLATRVWSVVVAAALAVITWFAFAFNLVTLGLDY